MGAIAHGDQSITSKVLIQIIILIIILIIRQLEGGSVLGAVAQGDGREKRNDDRARAQRKVACVREPHTREA